MGGGGKWKSLKLPQEGRVYEVISLGYTFLSS